MFDYANANENQRKAISSSFGPVLITAGPGTGKTFTLVQRAIYLIQEESILPEQIMIATFTEKAAKELITRITNELSARNISINVNEMYIGTFHSICLRILKENLEYTRLKKNYRLLDSFDQQYFVFTNIFKFKNIDNFELLITSQSSWQIAGEICSYVNNLSEELVNIEEMSNDSDPLIVVLARILDVYNHLLEEENLMDFSAIQTECFRLITSNDEILGKLQSQIKFIMVDEYQDTNYIQEQLIFTLAGDNKNICVVGDDDQGLYRFRGATIRNILEFPMKFATGECKVIPLVINYRSNSDIIEFYNLWMNTTSGSKFKFEWDKYRYDKRIVPYKESSIDSPCVIKIDSTNDPDEWHKNILLFIARLKQSKKITNYNQIAFLFNSVKQEKVKNLATFLENNGINVYSPRSDMYFDRYEIKLALGCLMLMFPKYIMKFENMEYVHLQPKHYSYYRECINIANEFAAKPENSELKNFIRTYGKKHFSLAHNTDYAYSGLLYQLFMFEPFSSILDVDLDGIVTDIRPTRNLALLTQIIGKYEYLNRIDVLNVKYIDKNTEHLFNLYLRLLIDGGISEYEDDEEYAPSGCVSFLTIHQSKGMEFPIVFVDSLNNVPRKSYKDVINDVETKYFHRPKFEPVEQIKYFDFWRLYYTAYSRAQNLLILTCNKDKKTPSNYFTDLYENLPNESALDLNEFDFQQVKNVDIKNSFSFTSHISVYEKCARQYKYYKELEFTPIRQGAMLFGTLVHETIEDVHKAAINNEINKITKDNITIWFDNNYNSLVKSEHGYLAKPQLQAALRQVLNYAEKQNGKWDEIKQAEVDVSLVQPDYIIEGKIDLVKGHDGTVELVDFKSETKPDIEKSREQIEKYRRQLHVYAYLVEQRTGQKVSRMNIYYTGEENGNPVISFPYTKSAIAGTISSFDETVHKILNKDFSKCSNDIKICSNCDFRFHCHR